MINKNLTDIHPKVSAVKADQIFYEPDHLDKLIMQNQKAIDMMDVMMELSVKKSPHSVFSKLFFQLYSKN